MSKCFVSITFDDGREDTYRNAFKILKEHNLTATIHVISGYVDGTYSHKLASSNGPISISDLKEMKDYGIEISLHGDKHITDFNDLNICEKKLKSWNLIENNYGFSMPHSNEEKLSDEKMKSKLLKDLEYVRVGKSKNSLKVHNKVFYLLYLITNLKIFYWLYNKNNIIDINNVEWYHLISVPVKMNDKSKKLEYIIKKSLKKDKWIIFMFHSILEKSDAMYKDSKWGYDYEEFEKFCNYLEMLQKKKKIKVLSVINVKKELS